jgi:beta-lactamase superfamily II metal-dependent hydrolase
MTITVLYNAKGSDTNNSSIVVMLEYGSTKFLFTGDIGEEVETKLVSAKVDLKCDVLKVGHHGSKYSSTASFLKAVGAKYGVICVGAGNTYGHPTDAALNRLNAAGYTIYRTDQKGHIVFSSNGVSLTIPN